MVIGYLANNFSYSKQYANVWQVFPQPIRMGGGWGHQETRLKVKEFLGRFTPIFFQLIIVALSMSIFSF